LLPFKCSVLIKNILIVRVLSQDPFQEERNYNEKINPRYYLRISCIPYDY
jgi:hypothetical protein